MKTGKKLGAVGDGMIKIRKEPFETDVFCSFVNIIKEGASLILTGWMLHYMDIAQNSSAFLFQPTDPQKKMQINNSSLFGLISWSTTVCNKLFCRYWEFKP